MTAESHAYGTSLLCISRRYFIMGFCALMTAACLTRSLAWIVRTGLDASAGQSASEQAQHACVGFQCHEVFSCYGMKDTTYHIMEPLMTLTGLVFYPLGLQAAIQSQDLVMKRFGLFMIASAVIHISLLVFDYTYFRTCNAYDTSIMSMVLSEQFLPPCLLRPGDQEILKTWSYFPAEAVDKQTANFNITAWYFSFAGAWALLIAYVAFEAMQLSHLMEHGLLGLGVHFGLDQWDEVLNKGALRRQLNKEQRSKFIEDANTPLVETDSSDPYFGYGYAAGTGYGTLAAATSTAKATKQHGHETNWRSTMASSFADGKGDFSDDFDEEEAEEVRALAERLSQEDSPEAILDRAFGDRAFG